VAPWCTMPFWGRSSETQQAPPGGASESPGPLAIGQPRASLLQGDTVGRSFIASSLLRMSAAAEEAGCAPGPQPEQGQPLVHQSLLGPAASTSEAAHWGQRNGGIRILGWIRIHTALGNCSHSCRHVRLPLMRNLPKGHQESQQHCFTHSLRPFLSSNRAWRALVVGMWRAMEARAPGQELAHAVCVTLC